MKNKQIKDALLKLSPLEMQAKWDNSGMQICTGPKDVKKILVAMEINDAVIDEAITLGVNFIVNHHPMIFEPLKSVHACDPRGRYVQRLIKADIDVFACHTPFDKIKGGNTDYLMKLLGIKSIKIVPDIEEFLKVGTLSKAIKLEDFVYQISEKLNIDGIKFTGNPEAMIKTVACCTGAGAELWQDAYKIADAFVTGDLTHHYAQFSADAGLAVIDAGHWGTEQIFVPNMCKQLKSALGDSVEIIASKVNQNPFNYML